MHNWMIFTDLDGTLLDHDNYSFALALPALDIIRELQIPLIINSSKTYAEIKDIRRELHNHWAFAVENGAAVFLPQGNLSGYDNSMQQIILGSPLEDILKVINSLREQYGFLFKGFSDYSVQALMLETGLTEIQAQQAKQRLASEPLKWLDTQQNLSLFNQALQKQGLQLIKGGRFQHVIGQNDKSQAMAWIINKFKLHNVHTIALGDSMNDSRMLDQADYAVVIRQLDGKHLHVNKSSQRVIYTQHPAPLGWQEAMAQLITNTILGERNE